ncbi:hypothetical protein SERLADRAFT_373422 [Serpula lacrymans var. lacrymans S7.9]|uniref:Uncharacterized protein n=1 Tax=Serpula lacrymans var. lacrymans (strain S7.9) TaxID=578457 RepID=F8P8A0_SERL9|nr:uncharacterized protein SERLADRAFT_373422 [Serpula lacrymans var. lacrymans S7.9]EGO20656.1 hypothetical protein SERLADRAFT_373422 [Serpula lacrymans var. lacrymans S7.9]
MNYIRITLDIALSVHSIKQDYYGRRFQCGKHIVLFQMTFHLLIASPETRPYLEPYQILQIPRPCGDYI